MYADDRTNTGAWISLAFAALLTGYALLSAANPVAQSHGEFREPQRICILLAGLLGLLHWWLVLRLNPAARPARKLELLVILIPAYALFQVLPFPLWLVRIVSPARARLVDGLVPILPKPSWVSISVTPADTMFQFLLLAACAVFFLVIYGTSSTLTSRPWSLAVPLAILGAAEAVLGIIQVSQASGPTNFAVGTFRIRNHYAGFLAMVLPFAALYPMALLSRKIRLRRDEPPPLGSVLLACISLGCAALILVGILYSESRMGFLSCVVSMMFVALVAFGGGGSWRRLALVGALVLAGGLFAVVYLPSSHLVDRLAQADPVERGVVWRDTRNLIAAYPLFGCGLGGYQSAFLLYKASNPTLDQDYAHNDYLQYLAELGLVGFVMAGVALGMILVRLRNVWRQPYRPEAGWLSIACAGSLLAIGVHSFVDFNLYVPANMFLLAWVLGIAASIGAVTWR